MRTSMKHLVTLSIILLSLHSVKGFAEDTLATTMHDMSTIFRTIRTQAADPSLNQNSAEQTLALEHLALKAKSFTPTTIAALPANEQPDRLVAFKLKINELLLKTVELEEAFLTNNNAATGPLFDSIIQTIQEGHGDFAPPHRP